MHPLQPRSPDDPAAAVALSPLEQQVVAEVASRRDELVALASDLIRFDTITRGVDGPAHEEADLQHYLAARLERVGALAEAWEPPRTLRPSSGAGTVPRPR